MVGYNCYAKWFAWNSTGHTHHFPWPNTVLVVESLWMQGRSNIDQCDWKVLDSRKKALLLNSSDALWRLVWCWRCAWALWSENVFFHSDWIRTLFLSQWAAYLNLNGWPGQWEHPETHFCPCKPVLWLYHFLNLGRKQWLEQVHSTCFQQPSCVTPINILLQRTPHVWVSGDVTMLLGCLEGD